MMGDEPDWMQFGLCLQTDPDLFQPDKSDWLSASLARKICGRCEFLERCHEHALERPTLRGIWGGHTAKERQAIRNNRPIIRNPRQRRTAVTCTVCGSAHGEVRRKYCSDICRSRGVAQLRGWAS